MSNKNYDSEFCGSLPLHQINQIQDYGVLMILSKTNLSIIQLSENASSVFKKPVQNVIGKFLKEYLTDESYSVIEHALSGVILDRVPLTFTFLVDNVENSYSAIVHENNGCILVELEELISPSSFSAIYQSLKLAMLAINATDNIKDVAEKSVKALMDLGNFDRVLAYQFDEDWNGDVIAEAKLDFMESYFGLKFPASDIPQQVRKLYLKNPYRYIANSDSKPVRLFPLLNPITNTFIDLSGCNLRSVPNVHLEYMSNMGIKGSMSIRIIRNEKLWGIISCHQQHAHYIDYEMCSVFEMLSDVISAKVSSVLYKEHFNYKTELWEIKRQIVDTVYNNGNLFKGLTSSDMLFMQLFNCTGFLLVQKNYIYSKGNVPETEEVKNLLFWLQHKNLKQVFADNYLANSFEPAASYIQHGSGILVIPVGNRNEDFILLFRPELAFVINWGGNPNDAIQFEDDGKKYHPRSSFEIWREIVKHHSQQWSMEELEVAESLRSFIFEYFTNHIKR